MNDIERRAQDREPARFMLGQLVRETRYGNEGVVTAVFFDLESAIEHFIVPKEWYSMQEIRPKTRVHDLWYSITLVDGAVLAGEQDLEAV